MSVLSVRIRQRREELGMSQEELAARMGYRSKSSITKIEKGITPITAEQNIERYIGVPAGWHADFALTCHGDSMSPTIRDGDIVCIRLQPEVEQGEIAAVRIGEEATLKHFHRQGDTVMLLADNAAVCPPMIYSGTQLAEIQIEGKAVGLCRSL